MRAIDTATFIENLRVGDHVSCIYKNERELFSLLVPFYIAGLKQHNKCLYVYDEYSPDTVTGVFRDFGFDLNPYIQRQDFQFFSKEDFYLKDAGFAIDARISSIKILEQMIIQQGYSALRAAGDASWLANHEDLISDFMRYESKINSILDDSSILAICQYKESPCNEKILIDVLRTHPIVYMYDTLVFSKYFAPTDKFVPVSRTIQSNVTYAAIKTSLTDTMPYQKM